MQRVKSGENYVRYLRSARLATSQQMPDNTPELSESAGDGLEGGFIKVEPLKLDLEWSNVASVIKQLHKQSVGDIVAKVGANGTIAAVQALYKGMARTESIQQFAHGNIRFNKALCVDNGYICGVGWKDYYLENLINACRLGHHGRIAGASTRSSEGFSREPLFSSSRRYSSCQLLSLRGSVCCRRRFRSFVYIFQTARPVWGRAEVRNPCSFEEPLDLLARGRPFASFGPSGRECSQNFSRHV